ncbi:UNVERIFIED_CONTAM: Ubiquitin domain-containing protein UBFD1 [Trichonephila clavipes]
MRIGSGNEPRNKNVRYDERTKNYRYMVTISSQEHFNRFKNRGGYSPERFDVEEHYTEGYYLPQNKADSEDYSAEAHHDTSLVTVLSPRPRLYIPSGKRNERTNYYVSNRKYDGKKEKEFLSPFQFRYQREKGIQLGTTEASRYWLYWVPAQYVDAIKDTILGKWQYF